MCSGRSGGGVLIAAHLGSDGESKRAQQSKCYFGSWRGHSYERSLEAEKTSLREGDDFICQFVLDLNVLWLLGLLAVGIGAPVQRVASCAIWNRQKFRVSGK